MQCLPEHVPLPPQFPKAKCRFGAAEVHHETERAPDRKRRSKTELAVNLLMAQRQAIVQ